MAHTEKYLSEKRWGMLVYVRPQTQNIFRFLFLKPKVITSSVHHTCTQRALSSIQSRTTFLK